MYQERFYRQWTEREDLHQLWVVVEESDLYIYTSKEIKREFAEEIVRKYRNQIKDYIKQEKEFQTSLSPLEALPSAPDIVKDMCRFSSFADTGPFSAVAGAVARYVGEDILKLSPEVIVENGGDLFLKIEKDRTVGVFFYKGKEKQIIRFKIDPSKTPLGISSSSSRIGHSLSFGNADLSCVVADNAILSDACATLLGNLVKKREDVKEAFKRIQVIEGVRAAIVVFEGEISLWGDLELA